MICPNCIIIAIISFLFIGKLDIKIKDKNLDKWI